MKTPVDACLVSAKRGLLFRSFSKRNRLYFCFEARESFFLSYDTKIAWRTRGGPKKRGYGSDLKVITARHSYNSQYSPESEKGETPSGRVSPGEVIKSKLDTLQF